MDADFLLENLVVWYGKKVERDVYDDYLNTYVEQQKPDFLPMHIYKILFRRANERKFMQRALEMGIELI